MDDADFLKLLASVIVGALLTVLGAWTNHLFSARRWEVDRRAAEVGRLREQADLLLKVHLKRGEMSRLEMATDMPSDRDVRALAKEMTNEAEKLIGIAEELREHAYRAPEPLVPHVRLMLDRMTRAEEPFDYQLTLLAFVEFREALDEYVRKGKTSGLHLRAGESPPSGPDL